MALATTADGGSRFCVTGIGAIENKKARLAAAGLAADEKQIVNRIYG
ncbi:MAG: hypothetical protein JO336_04105 [Acidobacteriia bacterium]|nr:hypothetical protein [Terriglobia bacterium]MBV8905242.1 hypothetical protein [Terriglobia bacterium]MBV9745706.1 hypothetical protein [Terriglobia bacterium]